MPRTPDTVNIHLQDLLLLLNYKWAAVNGEVGDLGVLCYEDLLAQINLQSTVNITPMQLADLIFHMKQGCFEKVKPAKLKFTMKNYNFIMRKLKRQAPDLFKELPSGEVVMNELEERVVFSDEP